MSRLFVRLSPHGVHNPASGRPRARRGSAWIARRYGQYGGTRAAGRGGGARAWTAERGRRLVETCNFSRYGRNSGRTTRESACLDARAAPGKARRAQRGGLRTRAAPGKVWRAQRGNASATRRGPAPDATTRGAGATSRARREGRRGGSPPGRSSQQRGSARGPCPPRDRA